jgi:small subunit ribosomal protein S15
MALTKEDKEKIIADYATKPNDTASSPVQIALLTKKLDYLKEHFKSNPKDLHSRMGLLSVVSQRKSLLSHLQRKNNETYKSLIARLGIRK